MSTKIPGTGDLWIPKLPSGTDAFSWNQLVHGDGTKVDRNDPELRRLAESLGVSVSQLRDVNRTEFISLSQELSDAQRYAADGQVFSATRHYEAAQRFAKSGSGIIGKFNIPYSYTPQPYGVNSFQMGSIVDADKDGHVDKGELHFTKTEQGSLKNLNLEASDLEGLSIEEVSELIRGCLSIIDQSRFGAAARIDDIKDRYYSVLSGSSNRARIEGVLSKAVGQRVQEIARDRLDKISAETAGWDLGASVYDIAANADDLNQIRWAFSTFGGGDVAKVDEALGNLRSLAFSKALESAVNAQSEKGYQGVEDLASVYQKSDSLKDVAADIRKITGEMKGARLAMRMWEQMEEQGVTEMLGYKDWKARIRETRINIREIAEKYNVEHLPPIYTVLEKEYLRAQE